MNALFVQSTQQQAAPGAAVEDVPDLGTTVRVVADFRSNALIVYASPRDLAEVRRLLDSIDVPASATVAEVKVFKLRNALAEDLEEVLNTTLRAEDQQGGGGFGQQGGFGGLQQGGGAGQVTPAQSSPRATMLNMLVLSEDQQRELESGILSDVTVAADNRTNSLVVTAPKGSMALIGELIRQLDELPTQDAEIKVYPIKNGDANSLIEMLNTLFEQDAAGQDGPAIQTAASSEESSLIPLRFGLDQRTNSIVASGNQADLDVVEAIIYKLDANDASARRTEVYELLNAQASNVAAAVTSFLTAERDVLTQVLPENLTPFEQIEREVVVVAEDNSNKLIISATDRYFEQIMRVIQDLDKRPDMVMIQVLIAEVTLNSTEDFGVEFGLQDGLLFDRSVIDAGSLVPGFNFNNQALGNASSDGALATRENLAGQALSTFGVGRTNSELGFGGLVLSASSESVSLLIRRPARVATA